MSLRKLLSAVMIPASALLLTLGLANQACGEGEDDEVEVDSDKDKDKDKSTDSEINTEDTESETEEETPNSEIRYSFDSNDEGFTIVYSSPATLTDISTLEFNADEGNPSPGCLALTTTYGGALNKVMVGFNFPENAPLNLTGKLITAKVSLLSPVSNDDENNPSGAKMYIKTTTDYVWGDGGHVNLVPEAGWTTITLDANSPKYTDPGYDPTEVLEIGIEFAGSGTEATEYREATILIDSIAY